MVGERLLETLPEALNATQAFGPPPQIESIPHAAR